MDNQREDELCLCSVCASQFYHTPGIYIQRKDPYQFVKDWCTYCSVRRGFDYVIERTDAGTCRYGKPGRAAEQPKKE